MTASGLKRLVILSTAFLLLMSGIAAADSLRFADGLEYNNFYAVKVYTSDGGTFTLFDAAAYPGDAPLWPEGTDTAANRAGRPSDKTMFYFFWMRRMGQSGAVTYPVSFQKIKEIRFTGPFGGSVENPPEEGILITGEQEFEVQLQMDNNQFYGWKGIFKPVVPGYSPVVITFTDGTEQSVYIKTDGFLGGLDEEYGSYAMLWLKHYGIDKLEFMHDGTYERCPECGAVFFDGRRETCPFDKSALIGELP